MTSADETGPEPRVPGPERRGPGSRLAWAAWIASGAAATLLTVLGFGGSLWWGFDLAAHFRVQYAAALALLAVPCAAGRRWIPAALFSAAACANAALAAPYLALPGRQDAEAPLEAGALRLAYFNVSPFDIDPAPLLAHLERTGPDLAFLSEISPAWVEALRRAGPYRLALAEPRPDHFGMALLARVPLKEARFVRVPEDPLPFIEARLSLDGAPLAVLGVHVQPPISGRYARRRERQLEWLAGWAREAGDTAHVVVIGDLNVTPWCHPYRRLAAATGLVDSLRGRGPQGSWPAAIPFLRIPIDHCLHGQGLLASDRAVGPDLGSDHLPLSVKIRRR